MDISQLTITESVQALREKKFSAQELLAAYVERREEIDVTLNAFLAKADQSLLRAEALRVDAALASGKDPGALAGIPMAIKDNIVQRGMPTTAAANILKGYQPPYDAAVVEKLRGAGALLVGKTNCDEFAMGGSGENSAYGPTKNPWDLTRVPGGSSSGSAVAVASGEALGALGSDTGGSIRQPAGFCGVVGLKPSYGRVSRYGLIALASSLDQIGPFARTVDDAALLLSVLAGHDGRDATSVDAAPINLSTVHEGSIRGMRIGVPKEYFVDGMDPAVERLVRNAIACAEEQGATIHDVSLPHTGYALAVYYLLQPAEASANLARYDGVRFGQRVQSTDLAELYGLSRDQGFGAETKRRIMLGTYVLSAGYYDAYYVKAQKVRTLIRQDFAKAFQEVDALLTPTSPTLPFSLGERFADPLTMYLADIFTVPANIAGLPGVSLPAGSEGQLPVGVQIMGPQWSEERVLTVAKAIERALGLPLALPSIAA